MKEVLISTQPKWVEKIASGKKTIELRKSIPVCDTPFKCYIYVTRPKKWFKFSSVGYASDESLWLSNGKVKMCDGFEFWASGGEYECLNGKVIGEFVCDRIDEFLVFKNGTVQYWNCYDLEKSCLTYDEIANYIGKDKKGYAWHITDLKIYDKPQELFDFANYNKYQVCKEKNCFSDNCWICPNNAIVVRPPQSWCYIERLL